MGLGSVKTISGLSSMARTGEASAEAKFIKLIH